MPTRSLRAWFIESLQCRVIREVIIALKLCLSCFQSSGDLGINMLIKRAKLRIKKCGF